MTATALASSIRFTDVDLRILDEAMARTGLLTRAQALRYVLRAWALAEGIEVEVPKPSKSTKKKKR